MAKKKPIEQMPDSHEVVTSAEGEEGIDPASPYVFDTQDVEDIARIAYEGARALQQTLHDPSWLPWDHADLVTKAGFRQSAQHILQSQSVTPEQMHQRWLDHKLSEGWKYGSVLNQGRKEHPNIVPWANLDFRQKQKDKFLIASVQAFKSHRETHKKDYWKLKGIKVKP